MNYPDEDYVRYYTRDTVGWRALGWEGQVVLALMLHGKFDRSGVFECDGHQPSHAVTLVTGLPAEVVEIGLERLLHARTWVLNDGQLVWPKFIEAQTCRRTDRARQEESRRNRRDSSLGDTGDNGHTQSPDVTRGHTRTRSVTPNQAEPSRTKPSQTDQDGADPVREVFEFWQTDTGHKASKLTAEKRKHIGARLKDFSVEQLEQVVRNRHLSPHYMGQNETKTVYDGVDNLFRNTDRVEKLLALGAVKSKAPATNGAPRPVSPQKLALDAEFARQRQAELESGTHRIADADPDAAKAQVQRAIGGLF